MSLDTISKVIILFGIIFGILYLKSNKQIIGVLARNYLYELFLKSKVFKILEQKL